MSDSSEKTKKYKSKRNFKNTPEPGDEKAQLDWAKKRPIFVIQKHDASNLHYDFRIEEDGVLKSWVIPKGPSTDPSEKRLIMVTEDHPLEYANFEGVIPQDEYGGGTVMIWDRGYYRNLKEEEDDEEPQSIAEQIESGHVTIWLEGEKLSGGFALIRTGDEDNARWLLIKMDDEKADARRNPTSTEPTSVVSGRTLEEIHEQESENND
jgi:DNA ligase D-like protein (predicted 3'-phosphoesterase)